MISISPIYNPNTIRTSHQYLDPASGSSIFYVQNNCIFQLLHFATVSILIFLSHNHIIFRTTNLAADYMTFNMMNWWNLLRIGECTLKNIVGNFWIMQFLEETIDFFFNIYIYFRYLNVDMIENA